MNYQQTLDWLFQQLASFQRSGQSAYKEDITNISLVCEKLDNPHLNFPSVHIAGTNGKGSCTHMLASILQEAGYKVGIYTSPHLKDFRERIKINGAMISESEVVSFVSQYKDDFVEIGLSFFEMTTALAFEHFSKNTVDIAIIETGLGGRLDATNIIQPMISVITNVALDHQNLLGDTIEEIAFEKAGIIKPKTPVILGLCKNTVRKVVEDRAEELQAPLYLAPQVVNYPSDLKGKCQEQNKATVIELVHQLRALDWELSEASIYDGFMQVVQNTGLRGRWETISNLPWVICDTGHNPEAIELIVEQLLEQEYFRLIIVLGMVGDKDVNTVLKLLPKEASYFFCQPSVPRALSAELLQEKAREYELHGSSCESPLEALEKAKQLANEADLIFVGGSTFVVADIL
jgi:dihydrofolate synthase/folylpolyglutamate synthase